MDIRRLMLGVAVVALAVSMATAADAAKVKRLPTGAGEAQIESMLRSAQPMRRMLDRLPREVSQPAEAFGGPMRAPPVIIPGQDGPREVQVAPPADGAGSGRAPEDVGSSGFNSIYHYTDKLVDNPQAASYRPTGWFTFVAASGGSFRCSGSLISRSIIATAGHCVHRGGGGSSGWIRSGSFTPAYNNGAAPYGRANADTVVTTNGWFNVGALDQGYDVALVVLGKRIGTTQEIGTATGWYGFCVSNCLQPFWYNTQLGYPANYYGGQRMTESQHLERSDTRDYTYGTGMEGGSSGGPHIANHGALQSTAGSTGQWPFRNVVFAATSWGYVNRTIKIGGASTLSGPGNSNNFVNMYNTACNRARSLHGTGSCSLL